MWFISRDNTMRDMFNTRWPTVILGVDQKWHCKFMSVDGSNFGEKMHVTPPAKRCRQPAVGAEEKRLMVFARCCAKYANVHIVRGSKLIIERPN